MDGLAVSLAAIAAGLISQGAAAAQAPAEGAVQADAAGATPAPSSEAQLGDIVVTAQRRSENLQRVAASVSAVTGQSLVEKGVTDVTQLTQVVPALRVAPGAGPYDTFSVRGINNFATNAFADPAVVVNFDGVPLSHPTGSHGLFYDLQRVEVVKGPQGILYGRNATGGVVNVLPNVPSRKFEAYLDADLGNYAKKAFDGALNVPISATLAMRGAFQVTDRSGYFKDGTSDDVAQSGRVSLRYEPTTTTSFDLVGDYSHQGGKGPGSAVYGTRDAIGGAQTGLHFIVDPWEGNLSTNPTIQNLYAPFAVRNPAVPAQDNKYYGVTGTLNVRTGLGTITFIPAYRGTEIHYIGNSAGFYVGEDARTTQYSSEIRLASAENRPLRYLLGGFYLHDKINSQYLNENSPTVLSNQSINSTTETYAAFGQLTWAFAPTARLTGGLRYTHETKSTDSVRRDIGFGGTAPFNFAAATFDPFPAVTDGFLRFPTVGTLKFNNVSWKVGAEWDVAPRSLLYANVGTGYKAGGFYFGPPGDNTYKPEKVTAYVVGSKNRFLDGKLQLNVEAFYNAYRDQQIPHFRVLPPPYGNIFVTDNAGKATIYGAEAEAQYALSTTTRLHAEVQYLHGKYDSLTYGSPAPTTANSSCANIPQPGGSVIVDCSGRQLLMTPKWVISGGFAQTIPLGSGSDLVAAVDTRYESSRQTQLNYLPETLAPSYTRTDITLTYHPAHRHWSIAGYVTNVENAAVIAQTQVGRNYTIANGGPTFAWLQPPREFGVRLHWQY